MKKTLFFACTVLLASACGDGAMKTTTNGFEYNFIKDEAGEALAPGQVAVLDAKVYAVNKETGKDTLLTDTREMSGEAQYYPMPTLEEMSSSKDPLVDLLSLMSKGDVAEVFQIFDTIPAMAAQFPDFTHIKIQVDLSDVMSEEDYQKKLQSEQESKRSDSMEIMALEEGVAKLVAETLASYKAGELNDRLQKLESGLEVLVLEEGEGQMPASGEMVNVLYYGVLKSDGTMFDNSYRRGEPISFPVGTGSVIKGWDQGLLSLKKGTSALLFIPSDLAYGSAGAPPSIQPNSDLVFFVDVLDK